MAGRQGGDKFARIESDAFVTATAWAKPRGLFTYPTAATSDDSRAWGTFEHINTGASGDFHSTKADPLQDMLGAFRNEYLPGASWLMRREVRTKIRKMKEATSDRLFCGSRACRPGSPIGCCWAIRSTSTSSSRPWAVAFAVGCLRRFQEAFLIVDRIGVRTLRDRYTASLRHLLQHSARGIWRGELRSGQVPALRHPDRAARPAQDVRAGRHPFNRIWSFIMDLKSNISPVLAVAPGVLGVEGGCTDRRPSGG